MSHRGRKQTVVIASIVIGIISLILMGLLKKSLVKIPFINNLLQLKNVGLDSMKDFLEVSELNLRVEIIKAASKTPDLESLETNNISATIDETTNVDTLRLVWDSDGSQEYIIFISSEYIPKMKLMYADNIVELNLSEVEDLLASTNWIRKIIIRDPGYISKEDLNAINNPIEESDRDGVGDDEKDRNWKHSMRRSRSNVTLSIKPRSRNNRDKKKSKSRPKPKIEHTNLPAPTSYDLPFQKFNCRVRSDNGRVSRHVTYPIKQIPKIEQTEIQTWITKEKNNYYIHIEEPKEMPGGKIYEYKAILYIKNGKGAIRTIPRFTRFTKFKLGPLPPCLCYLTGIRNIGSQFEQFVSWIGEEEAMSLGGLLEDKDFII